MRVASSKNSSKNKINCKFQGQFFNIEFDFKGDPIGGRIYHCKYKKLKIPLKNGTLTLIKIN